MKAAQQLAELSARKRRKLTPAQRKAIRRRRERGESAQVLADHYEVSTRLIYMVARGER